MNAFVILLAATGAVGLALIAYSTLSVRRVVDESIKESLKKEGVDFDKLSMAQKSAVRALAGTRAGKGSKAPLGDMDGDGVPDYAPADI